MPGMEQLAGPLVGLGFGGIAGAVVGFTAKKLTKLVAIVLGLAFILIQVLAYYGFLTVDWGAVQGSAEAAWQSEEGRTLAEKGWDILAANLPWGGGFVAGFAIGFKFG